MTKAAQAGRIVLINGTSSAGKTTLALALQRLAPDYWHYWALDQFRDGMPPRYRGLNSHAGEPGARGLNVVPVAHETGRVAEIRFGDLGLRMLRGMRRAAASFALAGNNLIIDDLCLDAEFLFDYVHVLAALDVLFVGLRCPEATLRQREKARPGRFPGTAIRQDERVHTHAVYDLEIDTSIISPEEGAHMVLERLAQGRGTAFATLETHAPDTTLPTPPNVQEPPE